jgi:hypothetical protein
MVIEVPDEKLTTLERTVIRRIMERAPHASYMDLQMRIDEHEERFEADWLRYAKITLQPLPGQAVEAPCP